MRPIRFADLAVTPWRNGAGRKADIAAGEGWLAGFAFLDRDTPFSDYAGHDRTITLVDGAGFELEIVGRGVLRVDRPGIPLRFDGGALTTCRLLDGPCRVLNAMTARASWTHEVEIVTGPDLDLSPPGEDEIALLVLLRGYIEIPALSPLDAVRYHDTARITGNADSAFANIRIKPAS